MIISLQTFKGIRPKADEELLGNEEAQTAENVNLSKGLIHPWDNEVKDDGLVNCTLVRTLFFFEDQYWFEFTADVDLVLAPIAADTAGKFYYTGDGIPKKSNETEATTGSGAMPINFYPMALPSPHTKLTATATDSGGTGDDRDTTYVWTVVSSWGEESVPSDPSTAVTAKNGEQVDLTAITMIWKAATAYTVGNSVYNTSDEGGTYLYKCVVAGTSGATEPSPWGTTVDGDTLDNTVTWRCYENNLSYKRIYRVNTGDQYANYQYVTQIAITATTYSDTVTDTNLAEVLPSEEWDPPIAELIGLAYMGNGILAGFNGKDLYFSHPYRPWAWPDAYRLTLPVTIVGIKSVGSTLVVATETKPYLVTGTDPQSMTPEPFPDPQPCRSKRGMAEYKGRVLFPTSAGLYMISGSEGELLTGQAYNRKKWADLYPATMHGHIHDSKYFGFYSSGGNEGCVIVDFANGIIKTLDFYIPAAYVDPKTDTLYFCKHTTEVRLLEGGVTYPNRANSRTLESGDARLLE